MDRLLPALLALVLLGAAAVAPLGAAAPDGPSGGDSAPAMEAGADPRGENTTGVLHLPDRKRSSIVRPAPSLSSALALDHAAFERKLTAYALEEAYANRTTLEGKQTLLSDALDGAAARVGSLRVAERDARLAYVNGSLSATEYVRRLATIDSRADHLAALLDGVREHSARTPATADVDTRISFLRWKLATLRGPVRDHAAAALRGNSSPRVYVGASETGVVLATIHNGSYVREVTRLDNFDGAELGTEPRVRDALNETYRLYPWATGSAGNPTVASRGTDVYYLDVPHGHGTVHAYLDGTTGRVFREIQTKTLDELPTGPVVTQHELGLSLRVNLSYPGGPLRARLTDTSGSPHDAVIRINGDLVGSTTNGTLWALTPTGNDDDDEIAVISAAPDGKRNQITLLFRPISPEPEPAPGGGNASEPS